jgi:hypothetical protein
MHRDKVWPVRDSPLQDVEISQRHEKTPALPILSYYILDHPFELREASIQIKLIFEIALQISRRSWSPLVGFFRSPLRAFFRSRHVFLLERQTTA